MRKITCLFSKEGIWMIYFSRVLYLLKMGLCITVFVIYMPHINISDLNNTNMIEHFMGLVGLVFLIYPKCYTGNVGKIGTVKIRMFRGFLFGPPAGQDL